VLTRLCVFCLFCFFLFLLSALLQHLHGNTLQPASSFKPLTSGTDALHPRPLPTIESRYPNGTLTPQPHLWDLRATINNNVTRSSCMQVLAINLQTTVYVTCRFGSMPCHGWVGV